MNILHWFKSLFAMAPFNRVATVHVHATELECQWRGGAKKTITWEEIQRVLICTTTSGPFDEDTFFIVETFPKSYVIPQEAAGAVQLLKHLQQLPGFNHKAVIEAMGCTENKDFCCWERS